MENILQAIAAKKLIEVADREELYPIKLLEKSTYFTTQPVSLRRYLTRSDKSGVIAEFKRKSPSHGAINPYADVAKISVGYMQAGASALSILAERSYFGGSLEHVTKARLLNYCPILQKDFMLKPYQVIEAKASGADAILLIAALLTLAETKALSELAHSLGLEVLVEVHSKEELPYVEFADIIGVNNRDLKSMVVSVENSLNLLPMLPKEMVKISESGIHSPEVAAMLKREGFNGLLVGERFMREADPVQACREFINKLNLLQPESTVGNYEGEGLRA